MKAFAIRWIHMLVILSIFLQSKIYIFINGSISSYLLYNYSWIDSKIPFITWFVYPYASWIPILYMTFFYLGVVNKKTYWRVFLSYNLSVTMANLCFILLPTYMPRPYIDKSDMSGSLIQMIYANDSPYNCFPSIHCITSYLLFIVYTREPPIHPFIKVISSVWMWTIIFSTVFIKQHALWDVVSGILLAEASYQSVCLLMKKYELNKNKKVSVHE